MGDPRMVSNMFDGAISNAMPDSNAPSTPLPLNLIALIISYLDRPSDLSRTCRTCRVFHYIALPQLYSKVALRSYDHIRYNTSDGRPEGCGMSSPFSMGLNGLVSRSVAGYVRSFEVYGEWAEYDLEEYARVGRVPEGSMMLNTLVRIAVEKMAALQSFSWNLNTKMLPTVWQAMASKTTLTHLTIKFPSKRHPRPMTVAPPIPNLEYLKLTDIDPLCYGDDINYLFLGSKKLQHLKMHWSPRMREAREPSVQTATYFGKILAAGCMLPLKSFAMQNLYAFDSGSCERVNDLSILEEVTSLNSTGGFGDDGSTAFVDTGWQKSKQIILPKLRMIRIDKFSRHQCDFLSTVSGLERIYLVNPNNRKVSSAPSVQTPPTSNTSSPDTNTYTSGSNTPSTNPTCTSLHKLKTPYLDAIIRNHGSTLKHLLLIPQWCLTADEISRLIRQCPNLEQLALRTNFENFQHLRLLIPFLSKLSVIRLLGDGEENAGFANKMRELDAEGKHEEKIAEETVNREWSRVRFMEVGVPDLIFEVGERYRVDEDGRELEGGAVGEAWTEDGVREGERWKRRIWRRTLEEVGDIAIWKMASGNI